MTPTPSSKTPHPPTPVERNLHKRTQERRDGSLQPERVPGALKLPHQLLELPPVQAGPAHAVARVRPLHADGAAAGEVAAAGVGEVVAYDHRLCVSG